MDSDSGRGRKSVAGRAGLRMADTGGKDSSAREAVAEAVVVLGRKIAGALGGSGISPKGDVVAAAKLAGIMAAKKTPGLVPLCHNISLDFAGVDVEIMSDRFRITSTVRARGVTGVEMEALAAVSVAALTVYDMCKPLGKGIVIGPVRLLRKTGGKSGAWHAPRSSESGRGGR